MIESANRLRRSATALLAGSLLAAGAWGAEEKPLPKDLPPFGADAALPVPPIAQSKTPEGLTVWVVARPGFPKVTAVLAVRGGMAADPKELPGLAELLADTVKDGTKTRSAKAIAEQLQAVGGEITSFANEDSIVLSAGGLARGSDTVLNVLADVARNASFPADEVKLAQANATQGLEARAATPEVLGAKAFAAALYGEHPYRVVAPTKESIAASTPEILAREYRRRFRPERSLLVVVGDLDASAAAKAVATAFGGWKVPGEAAPATPPGPTSVARSISFVDRPGSVQSLVLLGSPAPRVTEADYYPLLVANTIFGGAFGSRLTKNIREDKGYTYSPGSGVAPREAGSRLRVRAAVRNEVTGASLNEIFYELDRMGTTAPTAEEMQMAKRYQAGLYLEFNQIQSAVANRLATNWINGLPPQALGEFVGKINAVTPADVERVGRSALASRKQLVVVVGDKSKVLGDVEQFGAVTEVKP